MPYDGEQYERCLVFWSSILHRAFDDIFALANGHKIPDGASHVMPPAERAETLRQTMDWFFCESSESPVSLAVVSDNLDLDPRWMRARAKAIIDGSRAIRVRRRRLSAQQRAEICAMLRRGASTRTCAKRFGIDISTCRKARLRDLREKKNAAHLAASGVL
jgi:hypothetical protein